MRITSSTASSTLCPPPPPPQTVVRLRLGSFVHLSLKPVSLSNGRSAQKAVVVRLVECSPYFHRFSNTIAVQLFALLINYRECQSTAVCHILFKLMNFTIEWNGNHKASDVRIPCRALTIQTFASICSGPHPLCALSVRLFPSNIA